MAVVYDVEDGVATLIIERQARTDRLTASVEDRGYAGSAAVLAAALATAATASGPIE